MAALRFHATIRIVGVNPYVQVSAIRAGTLKPWRINMMPTGDGAFYLYLHGDVRRASNTKVGQRVLVDVEFDSTYRNGPMHRMPDWFRKPLAANRQAASAWKRLTPSRKKEILRYLSQLRSADARERNVRRALAALSGTGTRYMGRSWNPSAA
jgi:hypothetical protein